MRVIIPILVLVCFSFPAIGQRNQNKIGLYKLPLDVLSNTVIIEMPYNKSDVVRVTGDTAGLRKAGEMIIEIVCTDYPSSLSLSSLNKSRLATFYALFPFVNPKHVNGVQVIRQTDGAAKEKALAMFHGVVVHFRPGQTKETMKHDITMLEKILNPGPATEEKSTATDKTITREVHRMELTKGGLYVCHISAGKVSSADDYDSVIHISPLEAMEKGYITKEAYFGRTMRDRGSVGNYFGWKDHKIITIFFCRAVEVKVDWLMIDSASISKQLSSSEPLKDSTILKIFQRNKWKKFALTGDVTGSMYPYTAQLLLWLKLQSLDELTNKFSFFNDGDSKRDNEKRIGSTGGIYSKTCSSFTEVLDLVKSTMQKGGGGDAPENNIEALIQTEKQFPGIAFHVMIADNWAPLKDQELISQLTKPVRVVLCGVLNNFVNIDYMNLARKTGGSLHLMENDLTNLSKLHEGETITIGNKTYKIEGGLFKEKVPLNEKSL